MPRSGCSALYGVFPNKKKIRLYESLTCKNILSLSGWWFIRLSRAFVFPDPETPTFSILYGWSVICRYCGLCSCVFSHVTSSKIIITCDLLMLDVS